MKSKEDVEGAYQLLVKYRPKTGQGKLVISTTLDALLWIMGESSGLGELLNSWEAIEEKTE